MPLGFRLIRDNWVVWGGRHGLAAEAPSIGPLLLSIARRTTQPMLIISQRE